MSSRVILIIDLEANAVEVLRAAETEEDLVEHLADCLLSQTAAGRILRAVDPGELLAEDGLYAGRDFGDRVLASMKKPLSELEISGYPYAGNGWGAATESKPAPAAEKRPATVLQKLPNRKRPRKEGP